MYFLFCGVSEIFSELKRMDSLGLLPWKVVGHILYHGTMTQAHHKSDGLHRSKIGKMAKSKKVYTCTSVILVEFSQK